PERPVESRRGLVRDESRRVSSLVRLFLDSCDHRRNVLRAPCEELALEPCHRERSRRIAAQVVEAHARFAHAEERTAAGLPTERSSPSRPSQGFPMVKRTVRRGGQMRNIARTSVALAAL